MGAAGGCKTTKAPIHLHNTPHIMTELLERFSAWSLRLDYGKRVECPAGMLTASRHNKAVRLLTLRQLLVLTHFEHETKGRFFRSLSLYIRVNSKHDEYFL